MSAKIRTPTRKPRAASTKTAGTPAESGMLRPAPNVGAGRAPGKPPHAGEQPSFAEAKRQGVPERLPEDEGLRRPKARRLAEKNACASFLRACRPRRATERRQAGHPAYSGRPAPWHGLRAEADGPDAPGRRTSPASARSLSVCAVKKRARRPSMAPKREKSNKKGFPLPDKAAKGKPCLCSWGSVNPCTSRRRCSCRKDEWSEPAHGSSSRRARPRSRTGCGRCPCVHGCP